ncbi:TSUP family transporter [Aestuariicella hydrocarbonica]|uniref:Probable membrane transporter protein n=1 Tax=Pseudomaricurvus hydrocarbonicus TaxID=1470433 RepID=A0A9E5JPG1_9GAMM|nr:TSUP family transporter [Aestuariicella hydrocarbonica]NHO64079.1 TSUP family transporter [Aestuariicella hydrocarbonica]
MLMLDLSVGMFVFLTIIGFVAGFISAIAGSGGLIVLPVLLAAGIPPLNALATNKFQSVFGTLSSALNFLRKGHIDLGSMKASLVYAFVGAVCGTLIVQQLDSEMLEMMLPYLLIGLALYVAISPRMSDEDSVPRWPAKRFDALIGGGIGFYGGFLGPGMGSFYAVAFSSLRGFNLRKATAHTKPLVLITNTTSMVIFILAGQVVWGLAIAMAAAQFIGARLGSQLVIHKGAALIRPVLVVVILVLALKLLIFP